MIINNIIPFTINQKCKILWINLRKYVKYLYTEYKIILVFKKGRQYS